MPPTPTPGLPRRHAAVVVSWVGFVALYLLLEPSLGPIVVSAAILPVGLTGYLLGRWAGLGGAVALLPLEAALDVLLGGPLDPAALVPGFGHLSAAILGFGAGWLGDAVRRQRATHADLEAANQRWDRLVRSATDTVLLVDRDWRIVYVNDRTHGHDPDALLGRDLRTLLADGERERLRGRLEQVVRDRRSVHFQARVRRGDGGVGTVGVRIVPNDEEGALVVARDVTADEAARSALEEREERLREAQRATLLGLWNWDAASGHLDWDAAHGHIIGRIDTTTGKDALAWIHPADRGRVERAAEHARRTGEPFQLEHRILRPDGEVRWLDLRGRPVLGDDGTVRRLAGTAQDITDRKNSELERDRATQHLQDIIDASPVAIIELDLDLVVRAWNPAAERLFGWRAGEVVGRRVPLVPEEDHDDFEEHVSALFTGERVVAEVHRRHKDGHLVPVQVHTAPLTDRGGNIHGTVAMLVDLSDRDEARRHEAEVERLREMDAFKTSFLNMAAHELSTPLTPI